MAERIKVKVSNFPRVDFLIPDKPSYLSSFAFVQANRALAELERDLISARAANQEEISLAPDRASALILYGTYWAKKDGKGVLSQLKNFLIEKSFEGEGEERKPAVRGLPSSVVEYARKLGANFLEGVTDEELLKASLSNLKVRELKVKGIPSDNLEKAFVLAVEGDRQSVWSDAVEAEIKAFTDRFVEEFKSLFQENLPKDKLYRQVRNLSESVGYEIQRPFRLYGELMAGKNLFEALTPKNLDSPFEWKVAEDKLAALTVTLRKAYDPSYRPENFAQIRFADYSKHFESPDALTEYLNNLMTKEMEAVADKLALFYAANGFMPSAYEVVSKAAEKGIDNPFALEGEEFVATMEELFEVKKGEPQESLEEIEEELEGLDL